ncbi:MAG: hypothetical protein BWY57_01364 [Betaproteobacteria bacterium ADurb.Bin341]|nr:MAG: hypothetical protein BWY57_01364 [Betaproteobacteria bacterium ADurb.Bin341]
MKRVTFTPSKPALILSLIAEIAFLVFGAVFLYAVHQEDTTPPPVYAFFVLWFVIITALIIFTIRSLGGKSSPLGIEVDIEENGTDKAA